ncbi:C25 family cysteine peptidase [Spirosoma spitsbergense]|uniref:putative type IX secretion system sortase PorU2 n=1 Tax=Spirosoma spitsbergense TaxID=431554 RepID=UPI00036887B1|nr:C25 family cysteine peptidase [Spirosoma spitsbergense]
MKKGLLTAWFFVNALTLNAQTGFGNEWITPGAQYLKLSVNQTGIYRLNVEDINKADATFLQTNPVNWQVFFRGKEVAIRIVGQQDGVFGNQDYIEFYGESNDGSRDSLLYRPQKRLHPYQTLFSDKSAYFLTTNPAQIGKRIPELNIPATNLSPERFHVQETVQAFTSEYTFNNLKGIEPFLQQSYFEPGEGWSGPILTADSVGVVPIKLAGRVAVDQPVRVAGMVNGRDNNFHRIQVQLDASTQPLASLAFPGFLSQSFQVIIAPETIQNDQLTLRFRPEKNGGTNQFSITYVNVSYPQALDMAGQATKVFHVPANPLQTALLAVQHVPAASIAYDITDRLNCRYLTTQARDGLTQVVVDDMTRNRDILLTNQWLKPVAVQPIRFQATFPKLIDYLIVTHASLRQSAMAYADYRASAPGGGHTVLVVEADSLYDAFNYGERSPLALRRFADFMLTTTAVKNMLLIGKADSYPYNVKTAADDLVPTIGYPGSDILLSAGLSGQAPNTPAIPTGRLNVTTNEQVFTYLTKVKRLESATPNGLWRKKIIHISGGKSEDEAQSLRATMSDLGDIFTGGLLGGEVASFSKSNPYEVIEPVNIAPIVNEGVSLITFFGHAGPAITDMNFGFASPPQNGFRNPFYPLMIFNGCGVGEIFSRFNTLSTDWLLAPDKGSAVVLAHSYYSYEAPTARYLTELYSALFANPITLGMAFGSVQQQVNAALEKNGVGAFDIAVLLQMILQGDPALSLYPLPNPDFSVDQNGLYIQASVAGSTLKNSDSIRVVIPLANLGRFVPQSISLSVRATGKSLTSNTVRFDAFRYQDTLVYTLPRDETLQKIEVFIDPDRQITELSRDNNSATLLIDWSKAGASSSYPLNALPDVVSPALSVLINGEVKANGALVDKKISITAYLTDENPLSAGDINAVDVYLATCDTCAPQRISPQSLTIVSVSANQLQVTTSLSLAAGVAYTLIVFGKDAAGNRTLPPYTLDLQVIGTDEPITFRTYPNPATTYVRFELDLPVQELPTRARLLIHNLLGVSVFDDAFPVGVGKNSFLWQAGTPGLYVYSLRLLWSDGRSETRRGKVIWRD